MREDRKGDSGRRSPLVQYSRVESSPVTVLGRPDTKMVELVQHGTSAVPHSTCEDLRN